MRNTSLDKSFFVFSSRKNHVPTTERIMLLNDKDVAGDYRLILL